MRYHRLATLAIMVCLAGCSEKGFYLGLQTGHQMDCLKSRDREACLEGTDMSYEE